VLTATKIANRYPDIFNSSYCNDTSATICPEAVDAPELTDYWAAGGVKHNYSQQRKVDYIDNKQLSSEESTTGINVPDYTFEPNSLVKIEVHSESKELGDFTTSYTGGLEAKLILPKGLDEGYHSLHILGKSFAGDEVDIYDFLQIGQNEQSEVNDTPSTASASLVATSQSVDDIESEGIEEETPANTNRQPNVLGETSQDSQSSGPRTDALIPRGYGMHIPSWLWAILPCAVVGLWLSLRRRRKTV